MPGGTKVQVDRRISILKVSSQKSPSKTEALTKKTSSNHVKQKSLDLRSINDGGAKT